MHKEEFKLTANVHVHATHSHYLHELGDSHHHGEGTMVVYARQYKPHHHCDDKCIAALEAEIERLTEVIHLLEIEKNA